MKKTFKELQEIDGVVGSLYQQDPTLRDSKFGYAYKRFYEKNYESLRKQLSEAISDARIDLALEDPTTKAILRDNEDPRGYKYNRDGLKKISKKESEITDKFNTMEVDVEPYISTSAPELTEGQFEILKGCIVDEMPVKAKKDK